MQEFNVKTTEELEKLNDKRLLSFYKSERQKVYGKWGCFEYRTEDEEVEHTEDWVYIDSIKAILDTRGHVEK